MKPRSTQEKRGATLLSLLVTPLALPLYLIERIWRSDRAAPLTDGVMQIAQDMGVAIARTIGHLTSARVKKLGLRYEAGS